MTGSFCRIICATSCAVSWKEPSPIKAITRRLGAPIA